MTVNELIVELQKLQHKGNGETIIVIVDNDVGRQYVPSKPYVESGSVEIPISAY